MTRRSWQIVVVATCVVLLAWLPFTNADGCDQADADADAANAGMCTAPPIPPPSADSAESSSSSSTSASDTLSFIRRRGHLICAHVDDTLGHSLIRTDVDASGMEPDLCRGLAAAIGVQPTFWKMEQPAQRFPLLMNGEVDVIMALTSKTVGRDMFEHGSFSIPYFQDEHNLMVRSDAGIVSGGDLAGKRVCMTRGTTNPNVFGDYLRTIAKELGEKDVEAVDQVLVDDDLEALRMLRDNECHAFVNDHSVVAGYVHAEKAPEGVTYSLAEWPGTPFARAPFSAVTRETDATFTSIVDWFVQGLFLAEMYGVTSENVDVMSADPSLPGEAQRLLGAQLVAGHALPFDMRAAIRTIGNYAQVYERNFGSFLKRTRANTLYKDGGAVFPGGFR